MRILAFCVQSATPACQGSKEVATYRQLFSVSAHYTAHAGDSPNRHFLFPSATNPRPQAMCATQPICRLHAFDLAWVKEHCRASLVRTSNIGPSIIRTTASKKKIKHARFSYNNECVHLLWKTCKTIRLSSK